MLNSHFKKVHQLGVPEGFHRYTYRLEDGPVYRLKMTKSYEPDDAPRVGKRKLPQIVAQTIPLPIKLEVIEESNQIRVELNEGDNNTISIKYETESVNVKPEPGQITQEATKEICTRSRAAKRLQNTSK